MKKILLILTLAAGISAACATDSLVGNVNDGKEIFSGSDFELSPIDTAVKLYSKSQDQLKCEYSGNACEIKSSADRGLQTYTITIGPNTTDAVRYFTLNFYRESDKVVVHTVNIKQENVLFEVDEPADVELLWQFNDETEKSIRFNANFEFKYDLPSDKFKCEYDAAEKKYKVKPIAKNVSAADYSGTLTIVPAIDDLSLNDFCDAFTRVYSLKQYHLEFEVNPAELEFDANAPEPETVKVTYRGAWSLDYDEKLLAITKNDDEFTVELAPEGDFSQDKSIKIVVIADCDERKDIPVTIKKKVEQKK